MLHLRRVVHAICALVALTSAVVLVGWVLGEPALRNIVPGTVQMKALTAIVAQQRSRGPRLRAVPLLRARISPEAGS